MLVAFNTLPLRLTLSVAATTDGKVVTFRATLMGEGAGGAVVRAFFELLPLAADEEGDCFLFEESLEGVVEAFFGGRPRFLGTGVSAGGAA